MQRLTSVMPLPPDLPALSPKRKSVLIVPDTQPRRFSLFQKVFRSPKPNSGPQTSPTVKLEGSETGPMFLKIQGEGKKSADTYRFDIGEHYRRQNIEKLPKVTNFDLTVVQLDNYTSENSLLSPKTPPKADGSVAKEDEVALCRFCLDSGNHEDFIIPCKCSGSVRYVHSECLKAWLVKSDKRESDLTACEVCKCPYRMEFVYDSFFNPCSCEEQHAFYIPFILAIIILGGVLGVVIGALEEGKLDMVFVGVIAGVLGSLSSVCFCLSFYVMKDVCFLRRVVEWHVLSQELAECEKS
mmetsp:Transcript_934/g.2195  ORF Transcript_934/g.2195 Transcript_934/m.2195 type:complete len:297 (+) Transcript_934:1611-2501(+)